MTVIFCNVLGVKTAVENRVALEVGGGKKASKMGISLKYSTIMYLVSTIDLCPLPKIVLAWIS